MTSGTCVLPLPITAGHKQADLDYKHQTQVLLLRGVVFLEACLTLGSGTSWFSSHHSENNVWATVTMLEQACKQVHL